MRYHAGSETDALFAQKVMMLAVRSSNAMPTASLPYSTDMSAAWQAVEMLVTDGYDIAVFSTTGMGPHKGRWGCSIACGDRVARAQADTAPLAICRAVLALV